jgi:hypothetical protein
MGLEIPSYHGLMAGDTVRRYSEVRKLTWVHKQSQGQAHTQ